MMKMEGMTFKRVMTVLVPPPSHLLVPTLPCPHRLESPGPYPLPYSPYHRSPPLFTAGLSKEHLPARSRVPESCFFLLPPLIPFPPPYTGEEEGGSWRSFACCGAELGRGR